MKQGKGMRHQASDDMARILAEKGTEVFARFPVVCAYVYGSVARGDAWAGSDLDLAVLFAGDVPLEEYQRYEVAIGLATDRLRPGVDSDVRALNTLPLVMQGRVVTEGILVYRGDDAARVAFEVETRMRYFDFVPVYRRYQEASLARMRESAVDG
jgi:predicted nucleotidyltransferase